MLPKYYLLGLALVVLLVVANTSYACQCMSGESPCAAFGKASAVFVGTVTGVKVSTRSRDDARKEIDWTPKTVKFSVEQSFLGVEGAEVDVATGMGGGDCGYGFVTGQRYLVYAYRSTHDDRLMTSICTNTKPYEKANQDLQFLGKLRSLAQGVTIFGEVTRQLQSVKLGDSKTIGPIADIALQVEGEGERREIRTDEQGRYRLSGLAPGKYEVTILLPDELTTYQPKHEVTIADRGCASVAYYVADNGRIGGRVFDAEGQPAGKVLVTLIEADGQDIGRDYSRMERADDEGRYSITAVPPGRYLLAVNLMRYPEPNDPTNAYPRTYYPGVAEPVQATAFSLGAGEKQTDRDLRLLPRRIARAVNVRVLWADGKPVAKAGISFREVTYYDSGGGNNGASADAEGRFTISAYEGQTFVIEARSDRPYEGDPRRFEPMERTAPVRITVGSQSEEVKIVITKLR
jgi:hypothetical protein